MLRLSGTVPVALSRRCRRRRTHAWRPFCLHGSRAAAMRCGAGPTAPTPSRRACTARGAGAATAAAAVRGGIWPGQACQALSAGQRPLAAQLAKRRAQGFKRWRRRPPCAAYAQRAAAVAAAIAVGSCLDRGRKSKSSDAPHVRRLWRCQRVQHAGAAAWMRAGVLTV